MKLIMVTDDICEELVREGYHYLITKTVHDKNEFGSLKDLVTLTASKKSTGDKEIPISASNINELLAQNDRQYYVMLND